MLVLDPKGFSAKDTRIFADRTAGAFPARSLPDIERVVIAHDDADLPAILDGAGITLLANGGTPRIIGAALLDAVDVVNAHPGLLPRYRGASCTEWAVHDDEPVGVTAHFMDEGLDTGPIILSEALEVDPAWSYVDLRVAVYRLSHRVMATALARVVTDGLTPGSLPPQPAGAPAHRPIPDDLFREVVRKVDEGRYRPRR